MEQTEREALDAIESYKRPPDEPYGGAHDADPYAEAKQFLTDALDALDDPDPEDAIRAASEAVARIRAAM